MSNQVSIRKPSKVNLAQGHLEDAVTWLERVVSLEKGSVNEPSQAAKIDALQKEIKHLKQENSVLKRVNDQVSTRLGVAIKRLSNVIGG